MRITPYVLAGTLVLAGVAGEAAAAPKKKPKKPITKSYQATAPTPDFTNLAGGSVCRRNVPQSWHAHTFKAPAGGKLKVEMNQFLGDWDLLLLDPKGGEVAKGEALEPSTPADPKTETMTAKIKRPGSYQIIACNWIGGATANVKYTFTYA